MEKDTDQLAKIIWDFMTLNQPLKKVDCILLLTSYELNSAHYAADLFKKGYAPFILITGGKGAGVRALNMGDTNEALLLTDLMISDGVSKDNILIESKARNTGENIKFSKKLLKLKNKNVKSMIVIQVPYSEKRNWAAFKKQWPEVDTIFSYSNYSFEDYVSGDLSKEKVINFMLSDLQKLWKYSELGYQVEVKIPHDVMDAYNKLVDMGYDKFLIK